MVETVNYSVMVNGSSSGNFCGERGLRHYDHVSPYLYIMVTKILGRELMRKMVGKGGRGGEG